MLVVDKNREDLDLFLLIAELWRRRWFVVVLMLSCATAGVAYSMLGTKWYQAEAVLVEVGDKGVSSLAGQLGGLASLANISLGKNDASRLPLTTLKSRELLREFIQDEKLIEPMVRLSGEGKPPDIREAVDVFEKNVRKVSEDREAGTIKLSITWTDAALAADWTNKLVARVNDKLRIEAIQDSERNVQYLRGELFGTNIPALQQSLSRLLEAELQKLMLAKGASQYAFKIVDKAEVPRRQSRPRTLITLLATSLLGLFLAVIYVLVVLVIAIHRRRED